MRFLWSITVCFCFTANAQLVVPQGRFEISSGLQTVNIRQGPATNYFAVRAWSTNYVPVSSMTAAFTLTQSGVSVTNNWYGGYQTVSSDPINWTAWAISNLTVGVLIPGAERFSLQFTNLAPGTYGVQIFGVVTNDLPYESWREPLVWKIQANDAADGSTNIYHIIGNYIPGRNYDIGQFFVQALNSTNNIITTVSLDASSMVGVHVVALHFFARADWPTVTLTKTNATLYTAEEQAARAYFGQTNTTDTTVLAWKTNNPAMPTLSGATLTNIFNRWPPLNWMRDEAVGVNVTNQFGSNRWVGQPYNANYQNYFRDYSGAFGFTNFVTGDTYSLADFLSGTILPGTVSDYTGWSFTNGYWVASHGSWSFDFYRNYLNNVINNQQGTGLGYRYYTFPSQTNTAHTLGLMLAKIAVVYPSYRLEAQDINQQVKNPASYLGYMEGRWTGARLGVYDYYGWSGTRVNDLAETVDYLWPYVSTSTVFASDLTKFIPWIDSQTNNVKLLYNKLLVTLATEMGYRATGANPMQLGLVLQSGVLASNLMNPAEALITVTPSAGTASWKKQYAGSYVSDGVNLIGSSFYFVGENPLLGGPDYTRRYINNGGQIGAINITNTSRFPKLAAFVDTYSTLSTAYGYSPSFGDAAMSINEGPGVENGSDDAFMMRLWRLNPHPKLSKYIVDVLGRSVQTDGEWSSMQSLAASVQFDIRYPDRSRLFPSLGVGMLETGIGTTNQIQRGSLVMRTISGYGHDHGDHLDLNLYALGCRMGTDFGQRNEGSLVVYPNDTATRMHNVVEVDGYNHVTSTGNGWPGGNTEGGYSVFTAFSTNGSSQYLAGQLWNGAAHTNVNWQYRGSALVKVDTTNSYVVDFQRIDGGRFYSWSFHGADVGGEAAGITVGPALTNVTDFADGDYNSPGFFMRKHSTNATYTIQAGAAGTNEIVATWRLGRTATAAGSLANYDNNGGSVTAIAPEQVMFGSAYDSGSERKYTRAVLFDHSTDSVGLAWAFSPNYRILQPRLYVFTLGTRYFTNLTERSETWAALYEPYLGSGFITSETSVATDDGLTNAYMGKCLQVVTPAGTDNHYSSGTNVDTVAGGATFNAQYAFTRTSNSVVKEWKVVGGTKLTVGGNTLTITTNNIVASISAVDYTNFTLTLSSPLPVRRVGWYRIRNGTHETSRYITAWNSTTNASFSGDALVGEVDVVSVSGNNITLTSDAGNMVLGSYPKRGSGLTAQNESRSKTFSVNSTNSTPTRIGGDSIVTGDFTDVDGDGYISMWLYDFGPGDTLETPSEVYISKLDNGYLVNANIGFSFTPLGNISSGELTGQDQTFGVVSQIDSLTCNKLFIGQ